MAIQTGQRARTLSLKQTSGGWGLFDERDRAIFEGTGRDGRGRCLRHASSLGVLRLRFDEQTPAS